MQLPTELKKAAKKAAFRRRKRLKKAAKKAAKKRPFAAIEPSNRIFHPMPHAETKLRCSGRRGKIKLEDREPLTDRKTDILIFRIDENCL